MVAAKTFESTCLLLLVVLGPCSVQAFDMGNIEKMMTPEMMESMKNMMTPEMVENMQNLMTPEAMEKAKEAMEKLQQDPSALQGLMGGLKAPPTKAKASKKGNFAEMLQNFDPKTKTLKEQPDHLSELKEMFDPSKMQEAMKNFDPSQLEGTPFGDMFKNIDKSQLQEAMQNFDHSKLQHMIDTFDPSKLEGTQMGEMMKNIDMSKAGEMLKQMGLSGDMFKGAEL